jgi:hypothetical protein
MSNEKNKKKKQPKRGEVDNEFRGIVKKRQFQFVEPTLVKTEQQ